MNLKLCYLGSASSLHVVRWARYFQSKGCDLTLLSLDAPESSSLNVIKMPGIPFPTHRAQLSFPLLSRWLKETVTRIGPDLVHGHYLTDYGLLTTRLPELPVVLTAWGSDIFADAARFPTYRWSISCAIRRATRIATQSKELKNAIERNFANATGKIRDFPWGVDLEVFRGDANLRADARNALGIPEADTVVFFPRGLSPVYQVDLFMKAASRLVRSHSDLWFVVLATDGGRRIRGSLHSNGLASRLKVIRNKQLPRQMSALYNCADFVVSIPKWDQFALTLQEALACGCVAVVPPLQSYMEHLDKDSALILDEVSVPSLCREIESALHDRQLCDVLSRAATRIATAKFNWAANSRLMERLYVESLEAFNGTER